MVQASNLGYPRIGLKRELKKALEQFWSGKSGEPELLEQAATLRKQHWQLQQQLGLTHIPSNDFSLYDHVLDTIAMVGAVPKRYHWNGPHVDWRTYFVMARGVLRDQEQSGATPAMEMTKWFDTNYHYIVPEFEAEQQFSLAFTKPVDEFLEAKALGIHTRPVLLGPVSFLLLGKTHSHEVKPLSLRGLVLTGSRLMNHAWHWTWMEIRWRSTKQRTSGWRHTWRLMHLRCASCSPPILETCARICRLSCASRSPHSI